jgi:predicted AlkP superfamily phosphohydrolase/phosphomutase
MRPRWQAFCLRHGILFSEIDFDVDLDKVEQYHPGGVLPVMIFLTDGSETFRVIGEKREKEIERIFLERQG